MKQKLFLLLTGIVFTTIIAQAQVIDTLLYGINNVSLINESSFYKENIDLYYHTKNIKAEIKPQLVLRNESQFGLTIRPGYNDIDGLGMPLASSLSLYFYDLPGGLDLSKTILQIGEYDFDKDSISEIVITYGIKGQAILCQIYQYHEPANSKDAFREANWEQIGNFKYEYSDNKYLNIVKDGKIYFPVGSQGYSEAFIYVDGKFVKFQ